VPSPNKTVESPPSILLSFDAEEFTIANELGLPIPDQEQLEVGAEGMRRVLETLSRTGVAATFFMTVRLAEFEPGLVKELLEADHELASHGMRHGKGAESDLTRSRATLEKIGHTKVLGYRSPFFGPVSASALREAGYLYDSSQHPTWIPGRYNCWNAPRRPHLDNGLVRMPVSVSPVIRVPLFWLAFKNYPAWLYGRLSRWTLAHDGMLALVFHPWEFCEIGGFALPKYTCRTDGAALLRRLEDLITLFRERADFMSYGAWIKRSGIIEPQDMRTSP
jgi:hypothetical protein